MSNKDAIGPVTRRRAVATLAGGIGLLAAPAVVRAQAPLTVNFVQQRGLLYLPVDEMVSGGILQQEATKLEPRQGRGDRQDLERPRRR